MHVLELACRRCGWTVHALMSGANGSTPAHARADLVRALRWSADGTCCEYCRQPGRAARRAPAPAEACA